MYRVIQAALILALLLQPPATIGWTVEGKPVLDDWLVVRTDHFTVISNTDPERSKLIAYKLEQFRHILTTVCPALVADSPRPVHVRVFRDATSYYEALPVLASLQSVVAGFAERSSSTITINDLFNISDNVSYHEYIHVVTGNQKNLPLWYEEGVAQFYENFEVLGTSARLGEISPSRLHSLRLGPMLRLKRMLTLSSYQQIMRETTLDLFYAQSWAFMHFLLMHEKGSRKDQLKSYLRLYSSGVEPEEAFQKAFTVSVDELDNEFKAYLERSSFRSLQFDFAQEQIESDIEIRTLEEEKLSPQLHTPPTPITRQADPLDILLDIPLLEAKHKWRYLPAARPVTLAATSPEMVDRVKQALERFKVGTQLMESGQNQEALRMFEEAVKLDPEFGPAYANIGTIYALKGEYEFARLAYEKAREVAPGYAGTYLNFAITQMENGKENDAESSFRMALSLYPSSAAARLGLGQIYLKQRQYQKARAEFSKAINLSRGRGIEALNAYIGLAATYFYAGDYERARQQYAQAIRIEPSNAVWYRAYADCARMLKNLDESEAYYRKALSLDPKDRRALEGLDYLQRLAEYRRLISQPQKAR